MPLHFTIKRNLLLEAVNNQRLEGSKMGYNKPLNKQIIFYSLILILFIGVMLLPVPSSSRTSTNACAGCHSDIYELYISVTSYNVSSFFTEEPQTIQCNISVTGNMASQPANEWVYYDSNITVSASAINNKLTFPDSPKKYYLKRPGFIATVNLTVKGIGNGSETIKLEAKIVPWHKKITCTRTDSVNVPTQVKVWVPPMLSNGIVNPTSGSMKMKYTFETTYIDTDGDLPLYVTCMIDGTNYMMIPKDGKIDTVIAGETFTVYIDGSSIGLGTDHIYNFSSADFKYSAVGEIGIHLGPDIPIADSPHKCIITYPTGGTLSGSLNITGIAEDSDPGDEIAFVEVSMDNGPWMLVNGTTSWFIEVDLFMFTDGTTSVRARAYNGSIYSQIDEKSIIIDNSFSNTAPNLFFDLANNSIIGPVVWINGTVLDPELPKQEVKIFVGLDPEPQLEPDITFKNSQLTWSIEMNLSDYEEGEIDIYGFAEDPYTSCEVKRLPLILDIPNVLPTLTLDPLPPTLWGLVEFSVSLNDPDNEIILMNISIDDLDVFSAYVSVGMWNFTFNVSTLTEEEHNLFITAFDGEDSISFNTTLTVLGPYMVPIILEAMPESPIEIFFEENVSIGVIYRAQDHRGTTVQWFRDTEMIHGNTRDNISELNLKFNIIGDYDIKVIITNAQDSTLEISHTWKIKVKSLLKIQPLGTTEISIMTGEVVLLQFDVIKGEAKEISWMIDGSRTTSGDYLSYIPDTSGEHNIELTVNDKYGNSDSISYIILAEDPGLPIIDQESTNNTTVSGQEGNRRNLVVGIVGIIMIIVIILGTIMVSSAVRKSRREPKPELTPSQTQAPTQVQVLPSTTSTVPTTPTTIYKQPSRAPPRALIQTQAPTASAVPMATSTATPVTYPISSQRAAPVTYPVSSQRAAPVNIQTLQYQASAPVRQEPYVPSYYPGTSPSQAQNINIQNISCPYCYRTVQYVPEQNVYWCNTCQQYVQPHRAY